MKVSVTLQEIAGEILMPIPDELLAALKLSVGADVDLSSENGRLVVQPMPTSSNPATLSSADKNKKSL